MKTTQCWRAALKGMIRSMGTGLKDQIQQVRGILACIRILETPLVVAKENGPPDGKVAQDRNASDTGGV